MKKLMIAAAIVCAAVMSQASTAYWNFSTTAAEGEGTIWNYAGTAAYTGTGYLFLGTSQDDVLAAVRDGGPISGYETTVNIANGTFSKSGYTTETTAAKQAWYLVVQDGDNLLISESLNKNIQTLVSGRPVEFALEWVNDPEAGAKFDFATDFGTGGEGWYATKDVPEPTSGLLLLLGMAGLALKRRRA